MPLLVLANKQDLLNAVPANEVGALLAPAALSPPFSSGKYKPTVRQHLRAVTSINNARTHAGGGCAEPFHHQGPGVADSAVLWCALSLTTSRSDPGALYPGRAHWRSAARMRRMTALSALAVRSIPCSENWGWAQRGAGVACEAVQVNCTGIRRGGPPEWWDWGRIHRQGGSSSVVL